MKYLSIKVHKLEDIDKSIQSLLKINTIELSPDQWQLLYMTKAEIFTQTPKFCREWQIKANTIYTSHLGYLADQQPIQGNNW